VSLTAFHRFRKLASGSAEELLSVVKRRPQGEVLVFDDTTGSQIDLDLRGKSRKIAEQHQAAETRGRGRPRLGVIAKEVTMLPQHWDWLNL